MSASTKLAIMLGVGGSILIGVLFALILAAPSISSSTNASAQPTNDPAKEQAEKRRNARLAYAAIGADSLKRSMRDPDTFKLTSALIIDKTGAVCYEFRARNGFNGMNAGQAVLSAKGTLKTSEMSGFSALWNKECAGKQGTSRNQSLDVR
jgi:hypothetical protein